MADSATLDIILKMIVKGQKDLDKLKQSLGKTQAEAEKSGRAISAFGRILEGVGAGAVLTFAMRAGKMFLQMAEGGYAIRRAERALIAYTGSQWQAAAATKAVMRAANGLLSHYEAVQTAARLFSMGLAKNADEAARLTRIAIQLGTAMGRGPQQAFEEFTLLLSNQSIQRLDTFGISAARVRQRIRELQKAQEGLDRQTAFVQATLDIAEQKLNALERAGYQAGTSMDSLSAKIRSTREALSEWAASVVDNVTMTLSYDERIDDALKSHERHMRSAAKTWDEYIAEMLRAEVAARRMTQAEADEALQAARNGELEEGWYTNMGLLNEQMFNAYKLAGQVSDSFQRMTAAQANAALETQHTKQALAEARQAAQDFRLEMGKLSRETAGRQALAELQRQLNANKITMDEYRRAAALVMQQMLGMPESEVKARLALSDLERQFREGKIKAGEYAAEVDALLRKIGALPSEKTVNISLNVRGRVPTSISSEGANIYARQYGGVVLPGLPYIVGERRPEAFVPRERGRIVPEAASAPTAAPINVTVYPRSEVDIVQALEEARILGVLQ